MVERSDPVFELQENQSRRGTRKVTIGCDQQRRQSVIGHIDAGGAKSLEQALPGGGIGVPPVGGKGREIVRSCACHGVRWIVIQVELQHATPEDARIVHPLAEAFGYGAQILADDHTTVAHALERNDSEHRLDVIVDVGAALRKRTRNAEQTLQAHHVIDAQCTGVAHVRA